MALPTLDKSWIFKTNILLPSTGSSATDHRQLMYNIKLALTTASGWTDSTGAAATNSNPWVVVASSNGSVANTNDNWTAYTDLASGAANYAWTVLRQSQINSNFEVCLSMGTTYTYYINTYVSHSAGFNLTGLVTNAAPTATDRIQHHTNGYSLGVTTSTFDCVLNVAMSTDGQCTRIMVYTNNNLRLMWIWDKPKNPVSGWTNPSICYMQTNTGTLVPSAYTEITDYPLISARIASQSVWLYTTTEFYGTAAIGENLSFPNQVTGEWPMTPCGLACAMPGVYGRHAEIFDLWYTSTALYQGTSMPASGNRQFIVLPYLVHPWNRSLLVTA